VSDKHVADGAPIRGQTGNEDRDWREERRTQPLARPLAATRTRPDPSVAGEAVAPLETGEWALSETVGGIVTSHRASSDARTDTASGDSKLGSDGPVYLGAARSASEVDSGATQTSRRRHGFYETPTRPDHRRPGAPTAARGRSQSYTPMLLGGDRLPPACRSFDDLIETEHNHPICELLRDTAVGMEPRFNPILLWSQEALGKTHLLEATALVAQSRRRLLLCDALSLAADFERAEQLRRLAGLRRWLTGVDMLLLDNLQALDWSHTALHSFLASVVDDLVGSNKPVLFASSRPPAQLHGLERALRNRVCSGIVLELKSPSHREQRQILDTFLDDPGAAIDPSFSSALLDTVCEAAAGDLRTLRSFANQLLAHTQLWGQPREPGQGDDDPNVDGARSEQMVREWLLEELGRVGMTKALISRSHGTEVD